MPHAQRHRLHAAQHHRVDPFQRRRELDRLQRASSAGRAIWPSSRASGKPRQRYARRNRKVRCGTPWRCKSRRSGASYARGSRLAAFIRRNTRSPGQTPCRAPSGAAARCGPARLWGHRSSRSLRTAEAARSGRSRSRASSAGNASSARSPLAMWCVVVSCPAKSSSTQVATSCRRLSLSSPWSST